MVTGQTICRMSQETQTCSVVPLTLILTAKVFFCLKCVIFLYPLETFEVISTFFERCKHMKQDKIANVLS